MAQGEWHEVDLVSPFVITVSRHNSRLGCVLIIAVTAVVVQGCGEERLEGKKGWKEILASKTC